MSALIGALRVTLGLDSAAFEKGASDIEKRSKGLERSLSKMGQGMVDMGQKLSLAVTAPLALFGVASVNAASDAAELQSAFDQTFGAMSKEMTDWAQATGDAMGRSTQEIQQGANTFGIFFNQAAKTRGEAAELSKTFAVLAQDLSSFYNVDPGEAMQKLRSGLSGESEPLRDFGVFLTEAAVKAQAMKMGLADANGEISEQSKILARANLILEATKNAQGDVARTSDGTANKVRAAKAAFEELKVTIGTKLLPVVTPLIGAVTNLLNGFSNLPPGVQTAVVAFAAIAAAVGPLLIGVGSLVKAWAPLMAVLSTVAGEGGILLAAKAAFLALGTAIAPLLGPLAAIAAVGALIYASWDRIGPALSDFWKSAKAALGPEIQTMITELKATLSELWNGPLGDAIRQAITNFGDFAVFAIKAFGPAIVAAIKALVQGLTNLFKMIGDGVRTVKAVFEGDWRTAITSAVSFFNRMFGGLPAWIAGVMARMVNAVKVWMIDKLNAIWDGAMAKIEKVKKTFYDLYDAVVGHSYVPDMVDGIESEMDRLPEVLVDPAEQAAEAVKSTFRDAAEATLATFDRLAQSIRSGGFLDILSSAVSVGLQLGSIGAFGKGFATRMNALPKYANGTSFHPGGLAVVGERGPELVSLPRGSQVHPNGSGGGQPILFDLRGAVMTQDLLAQMNAIGQRAQAGAVSLVEGRAIRRSQRQLA